MTVFDLICELTHFDPYCQVMLQDKSGDVYPLSLNELGWNGTNGDSIKSSKYKSTELYIGIDKEVED
jgi:hypothetical protein